MLHSDGQKHRGTFRRSQLSHMYHSFSFIVSERTEKTLGSVVAPVNLPPRAPLIHSLPLAPCDSSRVFSHILLTYSRFLQLCFLISKIPALVKFWGLEEISVCWLAWFDKPMEILSGANRDEIRDQLCCVRLCVCDGVFEVRSGLCVYQIV